ncbi:MAG: 3-oxoacyl-[acyl-carrier-protein] reductase [Desulfohalobiaceae bacterium]|nr:3-oxoacyl-[acyl-carrier-protein] reductase [Desulfohalobiaceae bacterium]
MTELQETVLVTGGSRGIGRAIAETMGARGWQVFLTYVHQQEQAEDVCRRIMSNGGKAEAFALDISDRDGVAAFFKEKIKGRIHLGVLVNNAGLTKDGLLLRMKRNDWDSVLSVNLDGPFACLQEAAKIMIRQKKGRIINISSVVGQSGNPGQANYCAAKAGIIGLTKSAAQELGVRNITVNAVAPGFVSTDMTRDLDSEARKKFLERIPLGRLGEPEDIAETVAWLASDRAAYITGQVIAVNGGLYM